MKTATIYGAGISGATCARLLAEKGYKVAVYEARNDIGGLCYDDFDNNGLYWQKYGPHIFHTSNELVMQFVERFEIWYDYRHKVVAHLKDNTELPVPFNFHSLFFAFDYDTASYYLQQLKADFPEQDYITLDELKSKKYKELRRYIIKHIFKKYTAKQWGKPMFMVDKSTINRVPIKLSYDDTYFTDKFQKMPENSFTIFIARLLSHNNIDVKFNTTCTFTDDRTRADIEIITGPLDVFFDNFYGKLKYRSTRFESVCAKCYKRDNAVVNFTDSKRFTRITNFMTLRQKDNCISPYCKDNCISSYCIEYPQKCKDVLNEAYYPVKENERVRAYKQLAKDFGYLLCGRLACYEYLDMDDAIAKAINLVEGIENANETIH